MLPDRNIDLHKVMMRTGVGTFMGDYVRFVSYLFKYCKIPSNVQVTQRQGGTRKTKREQARNEK